MRPVTLKHLAQSLNLSIMAVSKALRDAPDISAATKTRVRAEAQRLNYIPNRAAQNLRSRNSHLVGVLVPQICHTFYSNLVWGVERQAEALGYQIILSHSLDKADLEVAEIHKLIARQVIGVVLVPAVRWQQRLAALEILSKAQIPTILLDRYPAGAEQFPGVSWVVSKDQMGMEIAMDHLLELGHEDIIFLAGPNGSSASAARFEAYRRQLTRSKKGFSDDRVYLAGQDIESGRKAMTQALSEEKFFSAVVAFNDSVALGAVDVLLQQGFRVPEEVSVIGFGDGLLAANYRVPLTTMRVPQVDMGSAAVHLLLELHQGHKVTPRELPVELVLRQSTAKCRTRPAGQGM